MIVRRISFNYEYAYKKALKEIRTIKGQDQKLQMIRKRLSTSSLSEKVRIKLETEEKKQKTVIDRSVRDLNLCEDEMDRIIELIYGIAAQIREAGKQEKNRF